MLVCVGLASGVCLRMLLRVLACVSYISRAAFSEGEALWYWTLSPSWRDSLFCSGQQQHFLHFWPQQNSQRQQYSVYGYILLRWADLHVFHHIFRALHKNYSLKCWMLAHNSTYPVHSYNKLREGGLANRANLCIHGGWKCLYRSPTCIDLSYQRFAPFFSRPPPCSISRALLVSLGPRPLGSSRHTTHRQLSIRARESLFVWSG